jgi:ribonuclease HII
MANRTWKGIKAEAASRVRDYLLQNGGVEKPATSEYESWRVRFSDATVTYYTSGTLSSTPSRAMDPAVEAAWNWISSLSGPRFVPSEKNYLIGLDEAGKGEMFGHTILAGAVVPKHLESAVDRIIGAADTKKKHSFSYWDDLYKRIDALRCDGLELIIERIPPWDIDRYNVNKILDVTYQRILARFFRTAEIGQARVVLDDYGIGDTLKRFLRFLGQQGSEVISTTRADDHYLEARLASVIAKRMQVTVAKAIRNNPEFEVNALSIGSGNAGDEKTLAWARAWHAAGKTWPWFVKRSWQTIRDIEGKTGKVQKQTPPINESLLSDEFLEEYNRGRLSIESLAVVCPHCGSILRSTDLATFNEKTVLKCTSCKGVISDVGMTLRYYCGYVVPDTNVIGRRILSKDLNAQHGRFFTDWTVVLCPAVRSEADGAKASRKELDELRRLADKSRIRLECPGSVEGLANLSNTELDEHILNACRDHDAIFLTADKSARGFGAGKGLFSIAV